MKPLLQLFGLETEQVMRTTGKQRQANTYKKNIEKLSIEFPDLDIFMKKKEKASAVEVKKYLFDEVLQKIYNEKHGIRTMHDFF